MAKLIHELKSWASGPVFFKLNEATSYTIPIRQALPPGIQNPMIATLISLQFLHLVAKQNFLIK